MYIIESPSQSPSQSQIGSKQAIRQGNNISNEQNDNISSNPALAVVHWSNPGAFAPVAEGGSAFPSSVRLVCSEFPSGRGSWGLSLDWEAQIV
jgi:hypothetical protein